MRLWEKVHLEIVQAHKVNVNYLCQWTMYARTVCQMLSKSENWLGESLEDIYSEVPSERAAHLFAEAIDRMASQESLERWGEEIASLNLLVARSDAYLPPWTPELQWQLALFLHGQGRAEEASHLMKSVMVALEDTEMPVEAIVQFFKDFARIVTTHDLCFVPQYRLAKFALDNARRYNPDDSELHEMTEQVLDGTASYLDDLYSSGLIGEPASFESRRLSAEKALSGRDLPETLHIVWSILQDFSTTRPSDVIPLANWLVSTLTNCLQAVDPVIFNAVHDIVGDMAGHPEKWGGLGLKLSPLFLEALRHKGLKFSIETSETDTVV